MPKAEWGADPEFFGPRHAYRERRMATMLRRSGAPAGPHLECAAGVGSFSLILGAEGRTVVAADASLLSLSVIRARARAPRPAGKILPVVADINRLPFRDGAFGTASSAETLEHVPHHRLAAAELFRVLRASGVLVGSVPAGPGQWSAWDEWAGHERRYTAAQMRDLLATAGFEPRVTTWGFPVVRVYDGLFLKRVNRRRLQLDGPPGGDRALRTVAGLGSRRRLVRAVMAAFWFDALFDGSPWGVGLFFLARKP